MAPLVAVFCLLAAWQFGQAGRKQALEDRFLNPRAPVLESLPAAPQRHQRLRLSGRYDGQRAFLVDNRVHRGQAGVHVLSPFTTGQGETLLVNRGWLPLSPDRARLPVVPVVDAQVQVSGFLDLVRQPGLTLGAPETPRGDAWPVLLTYPDLDALAAALDTGLYPMALYLDAGSPGALDGLDWDPFPMPAARHRAYAVTWSTMALAGIIAWIALGRRRAREGVPS